jgi:type IV pilus assembly protein PilN
MIRINLLAEGKRPAAVRKARPGAPTREWGPLLLLVIALAGLAIFGGWWWMLAREKADNATAIVEAREEVRKLEAIIKEVQEYKRKQEELQRKIDVIKQLQANQKGPVQVMDFVSRALPELLWLNRMGMKGTRVTITGQAFNSNAVANFIDNLDKVPEFQEPSLQDLREGEGGVYIFTVVFSFTYPQPETTETTETTEAARPAAAPAAG